MQKIMFKDKFGLTEAVLEGRKTMTRRIVPDGTPLGNWAETESKSRYKVGDVVAVAQSYMDAKVWSAPELPRAAWENKMFVKAELMPHQIRIMSIKAERLQDISDQDCLKEGIYEVPFCNYSWTDNDLLLLFDTPREAFAALIDKINGQGTWKTNPWVFAYEFKLTR